jgi:hypothetical protein
MALVYDVGYGVGLFGRAVGDGLESAQDPMRRARRRNRALLCTLVRKLTGVPPKALVGSGRGG